MTNLFVLRAFSALTLASLVLALAGCGAQTAPPPKTYEAKGKVVLANGQPYPGGTVEFRSKSLPYNALGRINPDGTFILETMTDSGKIKGAVEGPFQVTILPDLSQDQTQSQGGVPEPITLSQSYTVKPDNSNDFTITLPKGRR